MIVHGNYLEDLRDLAIDWVRREPLAPLDSDVFLAQSNGIAQWLKLAIAEDADKGGCGIAAAIDIQLPSRFLWHIYRCVLGEAAVAKRSPLDKDPLTWRLFRLLPDCIHNPLFAPLKQFLDNDATDQRKHYQLAERLADLFDQYQVYRSDWLQDWLTGKDQLRNGHGKIRPLNKEHLWQAALWRLLLSDLGEETMQGSRAGVHQRFMDYCQRLTQSPMGLPKRISIFGISALPAQMVEALTILAKFSQVILYVHNPCRYHWLDIIEGKQLLRHDYRRQKKKINTLQLQDLHQYGHPLLAAWGKQGRDYINLLDSYDDPEQHLNRFGANAGGKIDIYESPRTDTLLGQLQDDILELRPLPETRLLWPTINLNQDQSIRFHITHSPQREVEILHDQLLDLFNKDSSLKPRDILVMMPNVDKYAPIIHAVFGQIERSDYRYIPFTLSDRTKRGIDPLLIALEYLLQLPDSRFTVTDILDLFDIPAIQKKFNWKQEDLPILHRWIQGASIRWGINARQRESLGLPAITEQNSWLFGLRRMLLGYSMGNTCESWNNIASYDEIGGLSSALIGSLVNFINILEETRVKLSQQLLPIEWATLFRQLLDWLFEASNEHEAQLLNQLFNSLDEWLTLCEEAKLEESLSLNIVREAWLSSLDKERFTQNFIAGSVNFCTLMPMRAIPFKVICLLGMNDGDYPRPSTAIDFDLMAKDYRPGDRSRRDDDRYLLLEALLSARERLYISWVGRSIQDNSERSPSVLISQLRDHIEHGWKPAQGDSIIHELTQVHALQPFSKRYFAQENRWFSYAKEWAGLYLTEPHPSNTQALPFFLTDTPLTLDQLTSFLKQPVRYFFNQRLKVSFNTQQTLTEDNEPFLLSGLDRYLMLNELMRHALTNDKEEKTIDAILQDKMKSFIEAGYLPIAGFGKIITQEFLCQLQPLLRYHQSVSKQYQKVEIPYLISLTHNGILLQDWAHTLYQDMQGQLTHFQYCPSKLIQQNIFQYHKLISAWVTHIAANSCQIPIKTIVLGLDTIVTLSPSASKSALIQLNNVLDSWQEGMQHPLPIAIKSAFSWLSKQKNIVEAQKTYEGSDFSQGECQQHAVLMRQYPTFDQLNQQGQFEYWAEKLYQPIIEAEWETIPYQ